MQQRPEQAGEGSTVLVAVSGGIDSAVTAALLKSQGFDVSAVHFQFGRSGTRCSQRDEKKAVEICEKIGVQLHVVEAQGMFEERIVDFVVHGIVQNQLPNPCVRCNSELKFPLLFQKADELGFSKVATGHYAQVIQSQASQRPRLLKASDPQQDQSQFLFALTLDQLKRVMTPLGGISRVMVDRMAMQFGIIDGKPPERSGTSLCEIAHPERRTTVLQGRVSNVFFQEGPINDIKGQTIQRHDGLQPYYLGAPVQTGAVPERAAVQYVVAIDGSNKLLVVGPEELLNHTAALAKEATWLSPVNGLKPWACKARLQDRREEFKCKVAVFENDSLYVEFDSPQKVVAPGQTIVFYDEDEVIGGAVIERAGVLSALQPKESKK